MSEDTSALDHRNFCLSLSIMEGQQIAHATGFSIPSEDVQQHEVMEIVAKWMLLASNGSLEQIGVCAEWFVEITNIFNTMDEEQKTAMNMAISSFGVALIIHLLDNGYFEWINDGNADYVTSKSMETLRKFTRGG